MLKSIIAVPFIVCEIATPSAGRAQAQVYSPEKISVAFPRASRTRIKFLECKDKICSFQSDSPLAAVIFMADDTAQSIRLLSVTFHSSRARAASMLMKEALRFAEYPEPDDIDVVSLMKAATPTGKEVEIKKGLGARLVDMTNVGKNVFSFRFYRLKDNGA